MTREQKLQAINDMGVDIIRDCPYEYELNDSCGKVILKEDILKTCGDCWIKALEEK